MNRIRLFPIHLEDYTIMEHGVRALNCSSCPEEIINRNDLDLYVENCFEATESTQDPSYALQALEVLDLVDDPAAATTKRLAKDLIQLVSERAQSYRDIDKSLAHIWKSQDLNLQVELRLELLKQTTDRSLGQIASSQLVNRYVQVGKELTGEPPLNILASLSVAKDS